MSSVRAKTIEIFLPDGEPTGIKIAHIRNRNIEATYIPRARLNDVKPRESLQGVGLYMLVGESDEHAKSRVYIGEAECVFERLIQHNAKKDFWNYAIAVTSNSKHLTKTHVKFLEWLCHDKATTANRCIVDNSTIPTKSHVQESTEADLYDNFESVDLLVSTLGLNVFQPLAIAPARQKATAPAILNFKTDKIKRADADVLQSAMTVAHYANPEVIGPELGTFFTISARGTQAVGVYTQMGFLVFAGAHCAKKMTPSYEKTYPKTREALIRDGILVDQGDYYELKETYVFKSPSAASDLVLGRSSNGWTEWKTPDDGQTLHQLYREQAA